MDVDNAVYPTRERVEALMADSSRDPVVMLNLLKFRRRAAYPDGRSTNLTGRQACECTHLRCRRSSKSTAAGFFSPETSRRS